MRSRSILAATAALTLAGSLGGPALSAATAAPTAAKADPTVTVLAKKLGSPLSVAVAPDGTRYFSDNFAGLLYKQAPGAQPTVIYTAPKKAEVGAVSADATTVRFAVSEGNNAKGRVYSITGAGAPVLLADIGKYEKSANPDGKTGYGFANLSESCLSQLPEQVPGSYTGVKETHPYATATSGTTTYVADAGANAVFAVSATGEVSTVAALPPARVRITAEGAEAVGLPACTVGKVYRFEAVPTDIEVGPDGKLYVTSLPGGPEDGSLGANGRVLKVTPASGRVKTVVRGLVSPTGLAVETDGDIFVSQLFAGVISRIKAGSSKVRPYAELMLPGAVEAVPGGLVATVKVLPGKRPKGQVVSITP